MKQTEGKGKAIVLRIAIISKIMQSLMRLLRPVCPDVSPLQFRAYIAGGNWFVIWKQTHVTPTLDRGDFTRQACLSQWHRIGGVRSSSKRRSLSYLTKGKNRKLPKEENYETTREIKEVRVRRGGMCVRFKRLPLTEAPVLQIQTPFARMQGFED